MPKARFGKDNPFFGKHHTEITKRKMRKPKSEKAKKRVSETRIKNKIAEGSKNPNWKGGKIKKNTGYIFIKKRSHPFSDKQGYIQEHRLVVEKQIGRYLLPDEATHHLGKRDDNRPHMLMAFVNNSAHTRFHKNPNNVKPKEIIFDGHNLKSPLTT